jgi:hypothetical protein
VLNEHPASSFGAEVIERFLVRLRPKTYCFVQTLSLRF